MYPPLLIHAGLLDPDTNDAPACECQQCQECQALDAEFAEWKAEQAKKVEAV